MATASSREGGEEEEEEEEGRLVSLVGLVSGGTERQQQRQQEQQQEEEQGKGSSGGRKKRQYKARQPWTDAEDAVCFASVMAQRATSHSAINWVAVQRQMKGKRSAKQCRERWMLRLDPNISKLPWTEDEDKELIRLHQLHGRSWAIISREMAARGRSEHACKSRWRTVSKSTKSQKSNESEGSSVTSEAVTTRSANVTEELTKDVNGATKEGTPPVSRKRKRLDSMDKQTFEGEDKETGADSQQGPNRGEHVQGSISSSEDGAGGSGSLKSFPVPSHNFTLEHPKQSSLATELSTSDHRAHRRTSGIGVADMLRDQQLLSSYQFPSASLAPFLSQSTTRLPFQFGGKLGGGVGTGTSSLFSGLAGVGLGTNSFPSSTFPLFPSPFNPSLSLMRSSTVLASHLASFSSLGQSLSAPSTISSSGSSSSSNNNIGSERERNTLVGPSSTPTTALDELPSEPEPKTKKPQR